MSPVPPLEEAYIHLGQKIYTHKEGLGKPLKYLFERPCLKKHALKLLETCFLLLMPVHIHSCAYDPGLKGFC
jgi:hypothetical protein